MVDRATQERLAGARWRDMNYFSLKSLIENLHECECEGYFHLDLIYVNSSKEGLSTMSIQTSIETYTNTNAFNMAVDQIYGATVAPPSSSKDGTFAQSFSPTYRDCPKGQTCVKATHWTIRRYELDVNRYASRTAESI